jgi:hypothetical protein
MKKFIITLALLTILTGCTKQAESSSAAGVEFRVDRLFTHDSCTVYRFSDGGIYRYFVKCEGAATSSTEWHESCGKNCTRNVDMPTGYAINGL